jgi:S-adenosylmethionine synthetase
VQIAYAIGVAQPLGVYVDTFGTGRVPDERLQKYVLHNFDLRPRAIIEELDLLKPIYRATAAYGHFGRKEFRWEKTDRAKQMARDLSKSNGAVIESRTLAPTVIVPQSRPRNSQTSRRGRSAKAAG